MTHRCDLYGVSIEGMGSVLAVGQNGRILKR